MIDLPDLDPRYLRVIGVATVLVLVVTHGAAYFVGRANGKSAATHDNAAAAQRAYQGDVKRIDRDIKRGQQAGKRADSSTQRVDRYFHQLDEDARHDPSAPVDDCVLPDVRLQRWRAANAGPFASAAAAQSNASTGHAAAASERTHARPGSESP
ncbi:hypothetical protein [Burkholderia arboris]|uniref:hypothetical protein n=1 Tax=Burkholderia arboris TaxID=488730 RepID=UPI00210DE1EB|nr:hypothetical protein [Burkholderia arboris]UTV56142.1 hypothetical protein NLX30_07130 [Burkholderia arboris]